MLGFDTLFSHSRSVDRQPPKPKETNKSRDFCWPTIRPSFVLVSFIIFDTFTGGGGSTIIRRAWHLHIRGIRKISTDCIIKRLQAVNPREKRKIKSVVKHCQSAFRKRRVIKMFSLDPNVCLSKGQYCKTVH